LSIQDYIANDFKDSVLNLVSVDASDFSILQLKALDPASSILLLETSAINGMAEQRLFFTALLNAGITLPVIIKRVYKDTSADDLMLYAATDLGALLTDGFGDGVWIEARTIDLSLLNATSFGILQATRTRVSKTEYISCPSCGRTLFDLQETTQLIRSRTDHLKGIKIGIMGCIVNGPGEMADADYGYVGTGPDKITLYRGKEVVKKNVHANYALDDLIELIKEDGNWIEKELGD
jgi:(E)-4-hydroxy-3-methylbut-2-enyl-diphosphate synthase